MFSSHDFYVRVASPSVDVRVATREGRQWIADNLSLDKRRELLIARITDLDETLAQDVSRFMDDADTDAFTRGRNDEWRANNY